MLIHLVFQLLFDHGMMDLTPLRMQKGVSELILNSCLNLESNIGPSMTGMGGNISVGCDCGELDCM